jgi:hypothetical protein
VSAWRTALGGGYAVAGVTISRSNRKSVLDCSRPNASGPISPLVLVIERVKGGRAYRGTIDGRIIIADSAQPFLDAARVLLGEGHNPSRKLEMWRPGKASWDLRGPLWAAAKLDVERGRFVRHREIRPERLAGASKRKSATPPADTPAERTGEPVRRGHAGGGGRSLRRPDGLCAGRSPWLHTVRSRHGPIAL